MTDLTIRPARTEDAEAIHALVMGHLDEGHLLPRDLAELRLHAGRFIVCDVAGTISACAELAPLSPKVAEIRSLVVSRSLRGAGLAHRLVGQLRASARTTGFDTLTAFAHDPRFFVRMGFSIVPHVWVPEKILTDCVDCPLFRTCHQFAVVLPLQQQRTYRPVQARATARVA